MRYLDYPSIWYLEYDISEFFWCWGEMIDFVRNQIGYDPRTIDEFDSGTRIIFFESNEDRSFFLLHWCDKASALPGL